MKHMETKTQFEMIKKHDLPSEHGVFFIVNC